LFLFLVGAACLFPAATYCLFMAIVHRRSQPTLMSGQWDFVAVALGLSGFLLFGGTMLIFSIHADIREYWLVGRTFNNLRGLHERADHVTLAIWGLYGVILIGGIAGLLWLRRSYTAIYQLSPDDLDDVLPGVFGRLGVSYDRRGARWVIGSTKEQNASNPAANKANEENAIEVDGSSASRYVALHWLGVPKALRRDIEAELNRDLAALNLPTSPSSSWFMLASGCMFMIVLFLLATFLLISIKQH
jgi:hypothetical protein